MWLKRPEQEKTFLQGLLSLKGQVLLLRGARQVGKTSFALHALKALGEHPQILINLLYPQSFQLNGVSYLGRDFVGQDPQGTEFLQNIEQHLGPLSQLNLPALIFIDEVDRYPAILEAIQTLAGFSDSLKFILTGSNLENLPVSNAATGRKKYFDLYPISFIEFLQAAHQSKLDKALKQLSLDSAPLTEYQHQALQKQFETYLRLGGMPAILSAFLSEDFEIPQLPKLVQDLVLSIEENIKIVLASKAQLYEYQDVLRSLVRLSLNTLKLTHLQVKHASRAEAKRLVGKTVGARVAHKIRLFEAERDLSKYLIFDCGVANFLLHGADLLNCRFSERGRAILTETFVGTQLIHSLISREDLFYWKSKNQAELEFLLRSPKLAGIEVKGGKGRNKSLHSFALKQADSELLVKISANPFSYQPNYEAKLPNYPKKRTMPFLELPHYAVFKLMELSKQIP